MPFYQYKCTNCDVETDIFHTMQESHEDNFCENCLSGRLKKQISFFNTGLSEGVLPVKVGDVVKEFIKNSKKEVDAEKRRMSEKKK